MENFQLYNTNVLLGGQVCWDIYVNKGENTLYISDFQVNPVNTNIPYNYSRKQWYLLNHPHEENVQDIYFNISDNFYSGYIDPVLKNIYPTVINEEDIKDFSKVHNNIYEMGCNRSNYNSTGKTFEMLCPLWLEKVSETENLKFKFLIKNLKNEIISKITLPLNIIDKKYEFHNKFITYMRNYFSHINIDKGNDNVLNIDLKNKTTEIQGLSLTSGELKTVNLNSLTDNILHRERPLMEVDNMIISEFKKNKIIPCQLFNFRIHFNIEDLFQNNILNMMPWADFHISTYVEIDSKQLPYKDFFNNYDFIFRKNCSPNTSTGIYNVLDYLKDNRVVDLISKNKLYNPVIHWSLVNNNDYIFNLYDGFAGYSPGHTYSFDNTKVINHNSLYADYPDMTQKIYYEQLNNCNWCNNITIYDEKTEDDPRELLLVKYENGEDINTMDFIDFIEPNNQQFIYDNLSTEFNDKEWIHNIKYKKNTTEINSFKLVLCFLDKPLSKKNEDLLKNQRDLLLITNKHMNIKFIKHVRSNILYILSERKSDLTFAAVKLSLNSISKKEWQEQNNLDDLKELLELCDFLNRAIYPCVINFTNSVCGFNANSPSFLSKEITYFKENNSVDKTILRYDGKIKPTFLSPTDQNQNLFYVKSTSDELKLTEFYLQSEYKPLYPSIGYYSIKALPMNYETPMTGKLDRYFKNKLEYKWFNNSKILFSPVKLNVEFNIEQEINEQIKQNDFENKIYNELQIKYNITNNDLLKYIKTLYKYIIMSEKSFYDDKKKLMVYKYQIKLILK